MGEVDYTLLKLLARKEKPPTSEQSFEVIYEWILMNHEKQEVTRFNRLIDMPDGDLIQVFRNPGVCELCLMRDEDPDDMAFVDPKEMSLELWFSGMQPVPHRFHEEFERSLSYVRRKI